VEATPLARTTGESITMMAISLALSKLKENKSKVKKKIVQFVEVTHIGGSIVLAVKKHFTDPPRHLDVGLVRLKHPNQ
jgi:hypothetical protein